MESLGQDFTISPTNGILEAYQTAQVQASFEAIQAVVHKKSLKLEIADMQGVLGLMQSINITLSAEAYNVAVEVSYFLKYFTNILLFYVIFNNFSFFFLLIYFVLY